MCRHIKIGLVKKLRAIKCRKKQIFSSNSNEMNEAQITAWHCAMMFLKLIAQIFLEILFSIRNLIIIHKILITL